MNTPEHDTDVLIVGAGPTGLALACALADGGLRCTLIEGQGAEALAEAPPDGRDIALTHRAQTLLQDLGLWQRLPESEIAPLREAVVYNGRNPRPLRLDAGRSGPDRLGHLVPNHVIRRMSWHAALERPGVRVLNDTRVVAMSSGPTQVTATCRGADGQDLPLRASLLVAADSRFSETRRRAGIGAQMRDFGRSVIACRMRHAQPHGAVAQECFHEGHTLAVLPMNGGESSIVVTVPGDRAEAMRAWPGDEFRRWVQQQLGSRLGDMALVGERHVYPLVAVYAQRFVTPRFALVGDAAVGMHPVTAHGYNFGLYGVRVLADEVIAARRAGRDIGALETLLPYQARHRRETFAMFHGTNAIVGLFSDDRDLPKLLREAVIRVADHLPPLKTAIVQRLTRRSAASGLPLPPSPPELWRALRHRLTAAHQ